MSTLTDSLDIVTQYIIDKIKAAATAQSLSCGSNFLSPDSVFYGDQMKLPQVPAVCVEPNNRQRTLAGATYRTDNNFTVYLLCYNASVTDSDLVVRKQIQQMSEAIETLIHQDPQFGGLLVHGFCESNESGYTYRSNTLYRTNRILYNGLSRTALR